MTILISILIGFLAQMIDGALGMAYGVTCTSFLLILGLSPARASFSVKCSEIFTTATSGLFHLKFGNVDRAMFMRLCLPGVLGGIVGATLLSNLPGDKLKPFIAGYLLIMGVVIVAKAMLRREAKSVTHQRLIVLGLVGGLLDAMGGGGWGPVVTSTLITSAREPRMVIGTVNAAEFFVTVAQALTFVSFLGLQNGSIMGGLIIGGVIAAPIAAYVCKKMPRKPLMIAVGLLIIALSVRTIILSLGGGRSP